MKVWMQRGLIFLIMSILASPIFSQVLVQVDTSSASPGDTVEVPVNVSDVTDSSIESFQFDFFFQEAVLSPIAVSLKGTIAEAWGNPFVNKNNPGELRIGAYGLENLQGDGPIVILKFLVIGSLGDSTQLEIKNFLFNNGSPQSVVKNGMLFVKNTVTLTINSNVDHISIYVDQKEYKTPAVLNVTAFSTHSICFDSIQDASRGRRFAFFSRSDGKQLDADVVLDSTNYELNLMFRKEFYLTLNSQYDTPKGQGWYTADSLAHFSTSKYDSVGDSIRYHFLYWKGDTLLPSCNGTIKMDTSKSLTANYLEEDFVNISYNRENAGHTIPSAPGIWVSHGEELTIMAYAEENYHFLSWKGDTTSTQNPITIVISRPYRIVANFGNIFPIELATWGVRLVSKNEAFLHWMTKSETNNLGFYIQRKDSVHAKFKDIAFIKGKGTSLNESEYSYIDENLPPGQYSYRLKQVDFSGMYSYSSEKRLFVTLPNSFSVENYPNPFSSTTKIFLTLGKSEKVDLFIYNVMGQEVFHYKMGVLKKGFHLFNWDGRSASGEELPNGIYFLNVLTPFRCTHHKLILYK